MTNEKPAQTSPAISAPINATFQVGVIAGTFSVGLTLPGGAVAAFSPVQAMQMSKALESAATIAQLQEELANLKKRGDTVANDPKWMEKAASKMKEKGTVGKFGKATRSKIANGKKAGGVKKKEAVFAQNAKKAAKGKK